MADRHNREPGLPAARKAMDRKTAERPGTVARVRWETVAKAKWGTAARAKWGTVARAKWETSKRPLVMALTKETRATPIQMGPWGAAQPATQATVRRGIAETPAAELLRAPMAEAAQAEAGPQVAAAQGPVVVLAPGPVLARAQEARAVAQPAPRVQAAVVERLTKSKTH